MYLNIYSQYTIPEGTIKFDLLVREAKSLGVKALALTDHGNFVGMAEFYENALLHGIKPIIGFDFFIKAKENYIRVILYLKNNYSYQEAIKISNRLLFDESSLSYYITDLSDLDLDLFFIVICTYHIDYLSTNLETDPLKIEKFFLENGFDIQTNENFFFRILKDNNLANAEQTNSLLNHYKANLAKLIAINPIYYLKKNHAKIKKFILADFLDKKSIFEEEIDASQYLGSFKDFFHNFPAEIFENREKIVSGCNLLLEKIPPKYPGISAGLEIEISLYNSLKKLVLEKQEFLKAAIPKSQIEFELKLIKQQQLEGYFFLIYDLNYFYQDFKKENNRPLFFEGIESYFCIGYLLGLTSYNPLEIFGKYLKEIQNNLKYARVRLKVYKDDRNLLIKYLSSRFKKEHLAYVSEHVKWHISSIIRSIAKILDISKETSDLLIESIPSKYRYNAIKDILKNETLRNLMKKVVNNKEFVRFAFLLDDSFKYYSVNKNQLLISDENIYSKIPLNPNSNLNNDLPTSTFDALTTSFLGIWSIEIRANSYLKYASLKLDFKEVAKKISHSLKNSQSFDFIPFIKYQERSLFCLEINARNHFYNLILYLESFRSNLDKLKNKAPIFEDNKSISKALLVTNGWIVFKEQLIFVIEKLFGKSLYKKSRELVLSSLNKTLFLRNLPKLIYEKEDQLKINWLRKILLNSAFYSSIKGNMQKLIYAIYSYNHYLEDKKNFFIENLIEEIESSEKIDLSKYGKSFKKHLITIAKIEASHLVKTVVFNSKEDRIYLPLYAIKGISREVSDYLYDFTIQNYSLFQKESFINIVEKLNKEIVKNSVVKILIKIGFFDFMENNRKYLLELLIKRAELHLKDAKESTLFEVEPVVDREFLAEEIIDYSDRDKIEMEYELCGFNSSTISYQELVFFKKYLSMPPAYYLGFIEKIEDNNLFLGYQEAKIKKLRLAEDLNLKDIKLNLPVIVRIEGQTAIAIFNILDIYQSLNYILKIAVSAANAKDLIPKIRANKANLGNMKVHFIISDQLETVVLDDKISLSKTYFRKLLSGLKKYSFYLELDFS